MDVEVVVGVAVDGDADLAVVGGADEDDRRVDGGARGTTRASTILSLAAGHPGEAPVLRRGDVPQKPYTKRQR